MFFCAARRTLNFICVRTESFSLTIRLEYGVVFAVEGISLPRGDILAIAILFCNGMRGRKLFASSLG